MPSKMSKWARKRVEEARGDEAKVREGLKRLKSQRGVMSAGARAEYGAYMRELRRLEGLTDGLRLERDEFDDYLRRRREEDAKWRCGGTVERQVRKRPWDAADHGTRVMTAEEARLVDEYRQAKQVLRERGINPEQAPG